MLLLFFIDNKGGHKAGYIKKGCALKGQVRDYSTDSMGQVGSRMISFYLLYFASRICQHILFSFNKQMIVLSERAISSQARLCPDKREGFKTYSSNPYGFLFVGKQDYL